MAAFNWDRSPSPAPDPSVPTEQFSVIKQEVELDINFRDKSVSGVSTLSIFALHPDLEEIALDARQCEIDLENVTVNGLKVTASYSDPYSLLETPSAWQLGVGSHQIMKKRLAPLAPSKHPDVPISQRDRQALGCVPADSSLRIPLRPGRVINNQPGRLRLKTSNLDEAEAKEIVVSVPFKSTKIRDGLHFVGVDDDDSRYPHVYTRHSIGPGTAPCIFPCVDDPGSRHSWKVSIKCPRTLGDAFEQPLATQATASAPTAGSRKRGCGEAPTPPPAAQMVEEDKLMEITVICSGNLSGEQIDPNDEKKKIMTFDCNNTAAHHIAFAVGPFEHVDLAYEFRTEEDDEKLGINAAKIHAYCLPGRIESVKHTCGPIVTAADFFAPEFGRYPYESYKMCFVDDMVTDTASATSMTLCSTRLLFTEEIIEFDIEVTRTLVHALACQYVGVHIVPDQRSDMWLVVGLQWFMTDLFMKRLCGNNWYRFHMKTMSDRLVEMDVDRPSLHDLGDHLYLGDFEQDFMALKAPLVLFILDQRMSKIPGSTGVVRVISGMVSNANINSLDATLTSVSSSLFRRACEKKSQYRPDELWDQWVRKAGCPKLSIKQKFNKKNLNVDIAITQTQGGPRQKTIKVDDFWRELQEEMYAVYASEVPKLFTGPYTIRIHEADGTPYEHYLSIGEKDKNGTNLSIAYNTKYKRLKRTKKAQAAATGGGDKNDAQEDDVIYFNMLGDVLSTEQDIENWGLQSWSKEVQLAMDQESYEWIRFDCNFEWVSETITDMPAYMYLAQLQQDRDVVAHQDAMMFFRRGKRHPVASTIETKTVMDQRYYYEVRTLAVEDLAKQADPDLNYIGLAQLILSFRHFFCDRVVGKNGTITFPPSANNFQDGAQYAVQCSILGAIARTREKGRCSKAARSFLMDLLLFNDNSENEYSDHFYIAKLLDALTTSLIPERVDGDKPLLQSLNPYDEEDSEFKSFINKTISEIDKYRRMDEWTMTYHNVWTTTALNCKMRLMKARVIPVSPLEFVQYLRDDNLDLVRIKSFECLVETGALANKAPILRMLLSCMSTDKSPFVRDRLFKVFCKGIAAIALGENKALQPAARAPELDDGLIVVEQGDLEIAQRQLDAVRKEDITHALKALKEELKGNTQLALDMWKAFESPSIGLHEKVQLLDLISAMYEPEASLLVTLNYPKYPVCTLVPKEEYPKAALDHRGKPKPQLLVKFGMVYRTEPKVKVPLEAPPPPSIPTPVEPRSQDWKRIRLSSRPSFGGPSTSAPPTPATLRPEEPMPFSTPRPVVPPVAPAMSPTLPPASAAVAQVVSDSISVVRLTTPMARVSTPMAASPPPVSRPPTPSLPQNGSARPSEKKAKAPPPKKRRVDEPEANDRPKKLIKTNTGPVPSPSGNKRSKIVTVKFNALHKLPMTVQQWLVRSSRENTQGASSIVATPASARGPVNKSFSRGSTPLDGRPAGSPGGYRPASASGLVAPSRYRKPLPSAAPHHAGSGSGAASGSYAKNKGPGQGQGYGKSASPAPGSNGRVINGRVSKSASPAPPPPPPAQPTKIKLKLKVPKPASSN
ncbi:transcription initiation factor TFIID subunit 2 [Podospora conica]|nr:transcription initiation factor TFIID subunit 2 [Schizothecium conicum]